MWLGPSIRDLLETLSAAAPDAGDGLARTRDETLALLVALFRPLAASQDVRFPQVIADTLDAVLAERAARGTRHAGFRAA
jgi:hypothetical protein